MLPPGHDPGALACTVAPRLVLCLSVVHRVESALRSVTKFSASANLQHTSNLVKEKKENPPQNDKDLEAIMKEADSISKGVAKATDDLKKLQNKGKEKEEPKDEEKQPKNEEKQQKDEDTNPKRKAMDPVEAFRAMMCWGRKNLLDHEKCMEWMTKNCRKETTGEGYCKKLRRYVKSKCRRGSQKACDYAKDLGIDMVSETTVIDGPTIQPVPTKATFVVEERHPQPGQFFRSLLPRHLLGQHQMV